MQGYKGRYLSAPAKAPGKAPTKAPRMGVGISAGARKTSLYDRNFAILGALFGTRKKAKNRTKKHKKSIKYRNNIKREKT